MESTAIKIFSNHKICRLTFFWYLLLFAMSILVLPVQADADFTDDFNYTNKGQLSQAWNVTRSAGMRKNDWTYTVSRSQLAVTDIKDRSVNKNLSTVTLSRSIAPLTDFDVNLAFSWSLGKGKKIRRAVQTFSFNLYDTDNNLISSVGYSDPRMDTTGNRFISIYNLSPFVEPAGSSGKEKINLSRVGDTLTVTWDNWGTFSGSSTGNLGRIDMQFSYSRLKNKGATSYFGTESVDMVKVAGSPPVVPEPVSSVLFVAGGVVLAGRYWLKKKRNS